MLKNRGRKCCKKVAGVKAVAEDNSGWNFAGFAKTDHPTPW
jgi:hypothetical protein